MEDEYVVRLLSSLNDRHYALCEPDVPVRELALALGRPSLPEQIEPRQASQARKGSLSAEYGLEAFPWHTDGAMARCPPRWVMLHARSVSAQTSTELLHLSPDMVRAFRRTVLRCIAGGRSTRYLPAYVPTAQGCFYVRWDPSKCHPTTTDLAQLIDEAEATKHIQWIEGQTLIINNGRVLHRRPPVASADRRVIERTYIWND